MSKENSWREKGDAGGPQVKKRKMYPVDDELLTLLRTIRHEHVLMVLEPVLRAEGYCIDGIELTWIKFAEDSGAAGDFYSPRADNLHAVYLAEISGEVRAYAVYQPFSQKLYVLEPEEVIYRSGFPPESMFSLHWDTVRLNVRSAFIPESGGVRGVSGLKSAGFAGNFSFMPGKTGWLSAMSFIPDSLWKKVFIWIPKAKT